MGKERSRKKSSFGVIFWIAMILLVTIILLFNLPAIREVLESTNFVDVVFEPRDLQTEEPIEPPVLESPGGSERVPSRDRISPDHPAPGERDSEGSAEEIGTENPAVEQPQDEDEPGREVVVPPPEERLPEGQEQIRTASLYFIRVSDDGRILAVPVRRSVRFSGGPLTATIESLIAGPDVEDHNNGLLSLIPEGTELLSARVADGVAYLNFNEAFRFNTMGLEGYLAQMRQVVETATEFSTVERVQILINGQIVEYLGGDGIYIGTPISARDLRR